MYLREDQIEVFKGYKEKNDAGQDLKTFLEAYDPKKYDNPCNTVDTMVFTYSEEDTQVCGKENSVKISRLLLIKRGNHPSIGMWALPGGFVEFREDLDKAALRELQEETGVENIEVEQLKSYGSYDRDPRTRIITTAYTALIPEGSVRAQAADDACDSGWFNLSDKCESTSEADGVMTELHRLTLTCKENDTQLEAVVQITFKEKAFLKNVTYKVVNTGGLAADHGAIILEGYHHVLNAVK